MKTPSLTLAAVALAASAPAFSRSRGGGGSGGSSGETQAEPPASAAVALAPLAATAPVLPAAAAASAPGVPGHPPEWRIAAAPADVQVAPGEAASFDVRAEGCSGAFEYQWLRDGEPIESATASQYGFVTTLDDGGATFAVRVRPRGAGPGHERERAPATLSWREPAS